MYRHLLVPTDGTELSTETIGRAVAFAKSIDARITFLHVRADYASDSEGVLLYAMAPEVFAEQAAGDSRAFLAKAEAAARMEDVPHESVIRISDRPYEAILDTAMERGCDLIFMASHGHKGIKGMLVGSQTLKVLAEATIPVLLPALQTEVRITRAEFEDIVRPRVRETTAALDRSVRSAGLTMDEIDRVLLVGGSSRMPLVGQVLREITGRPISRDTHPKHTIALGAALFASGELAAGASQPAATATKAPVQVAQPVAEPRQNAPAQGAAPRANPVPVVDPPAAAAGASRPTSAAPATPAVLESPRPATASVAEPTVSGSKPAAGPADRAAETAPTAAQSPRHDRKRWIVGGVIGAVVVAAGAGAGALLLGGGSAGASAKITDIQASGGEYQVWFSADGFTPSQAGDRVRFYWNTGSPDEANSVGDWWGSSPVAVAAVADKPAAATQLCATVVNDTGTHGSGNCWTLPN